MRDANMCAGDREYTLQVRIHKSEDTSVSPGRSREAASNYLQPFQPCMQPNAGAPRWKYRMGTLRRLSLNKITDLLSLNL
jgi:hypothetical protein